MKAIVFTQYGSPDVLQLKEIEKPVPKDNEVLVKVSAASVNSWDWDLLNGKPYLFRLLFGLFKPKINILGADIAGRVEETGKNATQFKPGDEVLGEISESFGGFAEYVSVNEKSFILKPGFLSFENAAAIPHAAVLAFQSLCHQRELRKGDKVLINGGGGGVGSFAIQFAKYFGAEVTGVDGKEKLEFMRSAGAAHVIDYQSEDFTKSGNRYDLIVDVVANRSVFDYQRAMLPEGNLVIVGGAISTLLQTLMLGSLISVFGKKKFGILVHHPNKNLKNILQLIEAGKIKVIIDKTYPLNEVPQALQDLGEGKTKGKIVICI